MIFNHVNVAVTNPSTGAVLGRVPDMDAKDTERAVQAAYQAFQTFKKTTAKVSLSISLKYNHATIKDHKGHVY